MCKYFFFPFLTILHNNKKYNLNKILKLENPIFREGGGYFPWGWYFPGGIF